MTIINLLDYHPQVASYARGNIGQEFATAYRLPFPKHAPFAIGYAFEGKPHEYLPDVVGTRDEREAVHRRSGHGG